MAPQVIDLRKPSPLEKERGESAPREMPPPARREPDTIEWGAMEYQAREHGPYWFIGAGAIATALVILGILTRSWFFVAFIGLAYLTLVMYAKRLPREVRFKITADGVEAGVKFFRFPDLKSFWILDTPEGKELSLETEQTLSPYVRLPLGKTNSEAIRRRLKGVVPEKEHREFITERLTRSLGL